MRASTNSGSRASRAIDISIVVALSLFGLDAVSYAATGDSLIIGQLNSAGGVTTLKNTGSGATLSLISSDPSRPNLKMSSQAKIAKLNADLLDGQDSSAFLLAGGKAADADALDGMDSSQFVQGSGELFKGAVALPPDGSSATVVLTTSNPGLTLAYNCPSDLTSNGIIALRNDSAEPINVFSDNGGLGPVYQQLAENGGRWDQAAAAAGEHISFQIQGSKIVNIEVYSVHRPFDCHIQAQAIVAR